MSTWGKRFVMQVTLTLSFIMVPLLSGPQAAALEEKQPPLSTSVSLLPLPVVYNTISIGAAHIWVTDEVGFFRKHGLDVALNYVGGVLATQAIVTGSYPIGFVSGTSVINANLGGGRVKLVAPGTNRMLYALVTSRDITTPIQLKGKKVGIARKGDASETATRLAARELGLDPERDFTMLQIGSSPERFAALTAGTIDGMVADPADVVRAKRQGFNVLLDLTTREIGYVATAVAMSDVFIRDKRETALKFLRGFVEGAHYYKTHPEETVQIAAAHLKTTDLDMLRQAWKVFAERLIPKKPFPTIEDIQLTIQEVGTQNPAAKNATPEQFLDSSLMQEIDRSGFIDRLYR